MQNKESSVEITSEPKVQSRFGFQMGSPKILSQNSIKIWGVVAVLCLIILFLMKSPEPAQVSNQTGISAPEATSVNSLSTYDLESYSVTNDSQSIQQKQKSNIKGKVSLRLPGIESISRQRISKLPPGLSCKAVLISGASNGLVKAEITEDLMVNGATILPAGTQLIGIGQTTEDRLHIKFTQAIFQNGNVEDLQAQAADTTDLIPGLRGSKFSNYAIKYGAAVGLHLIGGISEGLQSRELIGQQIAAKNDTKNALLNGASKAAMETANETMTDLRNNPPAIKISAGTEIIVIFEGR